MNSTHQVKVVRITDIRKHPNADSLSIVDIGGYQCIVRTGDFKEGDLAYYVQPDSIVPQEEPYSFLWSDKEFPDGVVPEKYRRIKARRLRKEWSEGLLMPVVSNIGPNGHPYLNSNDWSPSKPWITRGRLILRVEEGDNVAEFLGITHYNPPEPEELQQTHNYERGVWPKSLKGWWYFLLHKLGFRPNGATGGLNMKAPKTFPPEYDVEALKNFKDAFDENEEVVVTEKIHGSNARYTFQEGKMYAGSRKLWKSATSKCVWRKVLEQHPWIEEWCRQHPGYTLYGEVCPTQGGFDYGCKPGETKFFAFDILTPEGVWLDFKTFRSHVNVADAVPVLLIGNYTDKMKTLADGSSTVPDAKHIREGVVIKPLKERHVRGLGRLQLKVVSNTYLEKA